MSAAEKLYKEDRHTVHLPYRDFDWKNPDNTKVFMVRAQRLIAIRNDPNLLAQLKVYYRDHPIQFIMDWGCTQDPRMVELNLPATLPFILFPRQVDWLEMVLDHWRSRRGLLTEKSRDSGVSWLAVALSCTLCLFNNNMIVGMGSRKEEYVDTNGDPKSLFEKARMFMEGLPIEFRGGFDRRRHSPSMRIIFPQTNSLISGESGDGIGRGNRTGLYFVDETAFLERPQLNANSLSNTTNCRIDISTPQGMGNWFAQRRFSGKVNVFTFHWREDPRKDDAWYARQLEEHDPVTVAQEVDINYTASVENVVCPAAWVNSAVNAHEKLGIAITGSKRGSIDIADKGIDANAAVFRHGILLDRLHEWSGQNSDIYHSITRMAAHCDDYGTNLFDYDADGIGGSVRGDMRSINEARAKVGRHALMCMPFNSAGKVFQPDACMVPRRKNKDYFGNLKAQSWWSLRTRFQRTHRAVVDKLPFRADELISINPKIDKLGTLIMELAQPVWTPTSTGKIIIDKVGEGTRSPNKGDAVMISYAPSARAWEAWTKLA